MKSYTFMKKKAFENIDSFEKRVNELASRGMRVVNFTNDHGSIVVLFEKERV